MKSFSIDSLLASHCRTDVFTTTSFRSESSQVGHGTEDTVDVSMDRDVTTARERTIDDGKLGGTKTCSEGDCYGSCSSSSEGSHDDEWRIAPADDDDELNHSYHCRARVGDDDVLDVLSHNHSSTSNDMSSHVVMPDDVKMCATRCAMIGADELQRQFGDSISARLKLLQQLENERHHHQHSLGDDHQLPHLSSTRLPQLHTSLANAQPHPVAAADDRAVALTTERCSSAFISPPALTSHSDVEVLQHQNAASDALKIADSMLQRLAAQHRLQQHVEWLRRATGCGVYIPRMLDFTGIHFIACLNQ